MNVCDWDKNAENYLRRMVTHCGAAVPSAFPTEIFEVSWALTTLIPRVISFDDIHSFIKYFSDHLQSGNGTLGFTKAILADAGDTSRALLSQAVLQFSPDVQPLLQHFFTGTHFRSYELEGSPSFTVNCNVLLALLECPEAYGQAKVIEQTLYFLLEAWENGATVDKWNLDRGYPLMLFSDCLLRLLQKMEAQVVTFPEPTFTRERLIVVLWQILSRVLESQLPEGSWGHSPECTSYSVIAVAQYLQLPWSSEIRSALLVAANAGQNYISNGEGEDDQKIDHVWVEKVSYGSALVRKSYLLCALHAPQEQRLWSPDTTKLFTVVTATETKNMSKLLAKTPLLQANPISAFGLMLLESSHYARHLRVERNMIVAESELPKANDKYVDFIPVFWVSCNSIRGHPLSPSIIWQMCLLSQFVYQMDAYMEAKVSQASAHAIESIKARLVAVCQNTTLSRKPKRASECGEVHDTSIPTGEEEALEKMCDVLEAYTKWVLERPSVLQSPLTIQAQLAGELLDLFLAHISHIVDNLTLRNVQDYPGGAMDNTPSSLGAPYFNWVTTIGANDTSCPFASLFFSCLISKPEMNCFSTSPQARYLFQSVSRHLAIMCRQYNDYGSAERDFEENKLNSLDFPEFGRPQENNACVAFDTASKSVGLNST
ncbi:hypothetical protein CC80DRAFT_584802 [Byssothecium circinans]|uniref:Ent-kaurene synthase n=1 Tax=Byssothecium circinans TaxID=147558 RepID=A0A6A5U5L9_9PLEO|nr:hypothetical protein CC80DRAFT_584802 [Byssothecium circinans]